MNLPNPSVVAYKVNKIDIIEFNDGFVICGVTGNKIPLNRLYYWDVVNQIPLINYFVSNKYFEEKKRKGLIK